MTPATAKASSVWRRARIGSWHRGRVSDSPFASSSRDSDATLDLRRRRGQLETQVAEMQWDLGGLAYEMAIRDRIRVDVLVRRAAALQKVDAELAEVERILRLEQNATAGECASCGAPHSVGAGYCWQCGQPLLPQVDSQAITAP
jgi:chorismate mutase